MGADEVGPRVLWRKWRADTPRLFTHARVQEGDSYEVMIWARNADVDSLNHRADHWLVHLRWDESKKAPSKLERRRAARQVFDLLCIRLNIQGDLRWPK